MALRRSEGFCRYVLSVQYHGSRFLGFTYQGKQGEDCILPNGTDLRGVRSVEGRLRQALDDLVGEGNYENIQVSSRTDRGVHGVKNTCHVDVRSRRLAAAENWDSKNLMGGLNSYLVNQGNMVPPTDLLRFQHRKRKRRGYQQNLLSGMQDVRVLNALPAPDTMSNTFYGQPPIIDWNARFSATERTYVYRILHTQDRNYGIPFEWDRSWRLAGLADDGLDIAAMNNAAQILTGTHDFSSFRGSLCQRSSPIVPISQISVHSQPHSLPGDEIVCGGLVGPEVGSKEKNHASLVAVDAEHELRIRNGMLAYQRLQTLRSGDKSPQAIAAFNEVKQDLGYGLLLKRYTDKVVDASDEQIRLAALDTIPDVFSLFWTFRAMVLAGFLMLLLFGLASWASIKRNAENKPWLLKFALFSLPLPWIAAQTGWYVAEHGRQPWSIAELLPTHLSASTLAVGDIWGSLVALVAFYTLLLVVEMFLMIRFARLGPSSLHTGRYHFELAPATPRHIRKPRDAGAVPAAAKDAPIEPTPV